MKVFGLDWRPVLATLPEWEALSPEARRAFLRIKPSQGAPPAELGTALAELVEAGFATATAKRAVITERVHPLLIALRAMHRVPLHGSPDASLMSAYLQEHFTDDELTRVAGRPLRSYGWVERAGVAGEVESPEWVAAFLALEDAGAIARWEAKLRVTGERPRLADPVRGEELRALVRALVARPEGVPLRDAGTLASAPDTESAAAVLEAGIRYLLVFPSLRGEGVEAVLGLAPGVAERLGPPPPPPATVEAAERFESPWRLGDMTTVLVEAATSPIPLRGGDGAMYARAQKLLAARLQPVPGWAEVALEELDDPGDDFKFPAGLAAKTAAGTAARAEERLADRASLAAGVLVQMGFAASRIGEDDRYLLGATTPGREWLALDEGARLRAVLDRFRASDQRNPDGWYGAPRGTSFFPSRISFDLPKETAMDLRAALTDAFLSIPAGGMVPLEEFLRFHARAANPFLQHGMHRAMQRNHFASLRPVSRTAWEELWAAILRGFAAHRLFAFGGARAGRTAAGEVCLGLTDAGRYLLGATGTFRHDEAPAGEVVVQPDFEILFLAPSPRLEPEVARVAERIGSGVGALFRLTRASVLRAAEQGVTADDAVGMLERISRTPVPANVARQIRDWMGSTRRISLHSVVLIECPDAETAARVLALTGGHGQQITPTLLRLPTHALERKAFLKKLREKGIFVSG